MGPDIFTSGPISGYFPVTNTPLPISPGVAIGDAVYYLSPTATKV